MHFEDFVLDLARELREREQDLKDRLYTADEGDSSERIRGAISETKSLLDFLKEKARRANVELEELV